MTVVGMSSDAVRELYTDSFSLVTWDERANIVRWTRTSTRFPSVKDAIDSYLALRAAVQPAIAARASLLVDIRMAPLRNDPEFDQIAKQYIDPLTARFAKVAVLVSTAVGKLQLNRIKRERSLQIEVFDDEALALAFVRS
jgi:hypothetical protein